MFYLVKGQIALFDVTKISLSQFYSYNYRKMNVYFFYMIYRTGTWAGDIELTNCIKILKLKRNKILFYYVVVSKKKKHYQSLLSKLAHIIASAN